MVFSGGSTRRRFAIVGVIVLATGLAACTQHSAARSCGGDAAYQQALAANESASQEIGRGDFARANERLKTALDAFRYRDALPRETNDDTGLRTTHAASAELNGSLRLASTLRRDALGERLALYRRYACGAHVTARAGTSRKRSRAQ